jgi:hypothetical protein
MDVTVTNTSDNPGTVEFDTVSGTAGSDRLIVTFTVDVVSISLI